MDDTYLRAVIASNRDAEHAAVEDEARITKWSESDIQKALDPNNADVRRLTSAPAQNPEVERLAGLLSDILRP